jgi:hypothetical protein
MRDMSQTGKNFIVRAWEMVPNHVGEEARVGEE